ncbi:Beta-monoglucosyldiacylglycerol synthase [Phycisphaerae bacterium RAS1]|nr:Beta-monoglucosyldiacylglycerol synthase [Phycisphaerae bacterium RAS1]
MLLPDAETLCWAAVLAYFSILAILCVYGLHRYFLVLTYLRVRRQAPQPAGAFESLPRVTVQLPMFNERYVAERIIEQACRIDYPRDLLDIQVLDDSTDETRQLAQQAVERMRAAGHNVSYLHRSDRTGYKAGALAAGLQQAAGEFVVIFDADFVPPADILRRTIHYFSDQRVGMVQSRWDHLNRNASVLTNAQAILLDGHFMIEHTARNRSGRYMSFNGTAGVWRRSAIEDAGGWQHDTLTEDLDLSYRAQLRGWKFVFLPDLTSPAELPPEMNAFKAQQHRWTKGGAQTCVKLLPRVLASAADWRVKVEAVFHLTSGVVYVLMVLLSLLLGPALWAKLILSGPTSVWQWLFEAFLFVVGFGSAIAFYVYSQREQLKSWYDSIRFLPALMAVGIGIAFNNAIAALEGFFGGTGEFVRTPKFGDAAGKSGEWKRRAGAFRGKHGWQVWAELFMGVYLLAWVLPMFLHPKWVERISAALPFVAIFISGYFYIAWQTLATHWRAGRSASPAAG